MTTTVRLARGSVAGSWFIGANGDYACTDACPMISSHLRNANPHNLHVRPIIEAFSIPLRCLPMLKSHLSFSALLFVLCAACLSVAPAGTPPGISTLDPIDLSPGPDAYNPIDLAGNNNTHRLYVLSGIAGPDGFPAPSDPTYRVKVIDTTSNSTIAGIDLGLYHFSNSALPFTPRDIAPDDSMTAGGNKIYVLGFADYTYLRTIDGATNTNQTGQGTDLRLVNEGDQLVVNSNNHKVYVVSFDGKVTIVDGTTNTVVSTITESIGLYSHDLVVNPENNKVFVFGSSKGLIIDGDTNSYTILDAPYLFARAALFDPNSGHILLIAAPDNVSTPVLYALDGTDGAVLQTQPDIPPNVQAMAVDAASNNLFLAQPFDSQLATTGKIDVYNLELLLPAAMSYDTAAARLASLGAGTSSRLYFLNYDFYFKSDLLEYRNTVGALYPLNGTVQKITVGYSPGTIAINPLTNLIYVADLKAPEITVLDAVTRDVVDHIAVAPAGSAAFFGTSVPPRALAVSLSRNRIYLSRSATDPDSGVSTMYVDVYDGTSKLLVNSIVVNTDATSATYPRIAIDDTRKLLFATGYSSTGNPSYFVKVYENEGFLTTIPLPANPSNLAVNPLTGLVYLSGFSNMAMILDPVTATVTQVQTGAPGPVAINSKTNRIFIVQGGSDNKIAVLNGATGEKETTVSNTNENTGDAVTDVAIDDVTNTLLVGDDSNQEESVGRITVFDAADNYAFLGQVDVGRYPANIAFSTSTRQLLVANDQDGTLSVLQSATPGPPSRLANIATRLGVETDDNVLIGGFIVTGPEGSSKQVLIRGIGPSLADQGVTGALADPSLELYSGASLIGTNDNWKIDQDGNSQQAAIEATTIPPPNDLESAILVNLAPGSFTAVLRGTNRGTGVGLVEVYDLTESATNKMVNISTRGRVETGDNIMIGGIILTGATPSRVLMRALGPSLVDAGIADALSDPVLELYNNQGTLIITNDDWKDDDLVGIANTGIPPTDDRETAILATLYPSNYTAIVRGKDDAVGVGLVEMYYLPPD
jgi:DNA-binding beta-propeller fold protein YncE